MIYAREPFCRAMSQPIRVMMNVPRSLFYSVVTVYFGVLGSAYLLTSIALAIVSTIGFVAVLFWLSAVTRRDPYILNRFFFGLFAKKHYVANAGLRSKIRV